jgi:transcriptional regulator with XRE-family HTH domain
LFNREKEKNMADDSAVDASGPQSGSPSQEGGAGRDAACRKDVLASRLRAARGVLGLTQRQVAQKAQMPLPSYKDYEAGNRMPGGEALELLIFAGINANWLLTGEGPMLMAELDGPAVPAAVNAATLEGIIGSVEEALALRRLKLEPEKKAQLIGLIYDFSTQVGSFEPAMVERFIKLAL